MGKYSLWVLYGGLLTACSSGPVEKARPVRAPLAHEGATAVLDSANTRSSEAKKVKLTAVTAAQLPAVLRMSGQLLEAWRWTDGNGENLLVAYRKVTQSKNEQAIGTNPELKKQLENPGVVRMAEDDARAAQLFVRQYTRRGAGYQELWHLYDFVDECPLDMSLGPLPGATSVTDLDANGQTETTVLYSSACRGGVDPADLKLIMHEGKAKFALRGSTIQVLNYNGDGARLQQKIAGPICCTDQLPAKGVDDGSQSEGLYQNEKDFAGAPPAFLAFAQQQWRKWRTHENTDQL